MKSTDNNLEELSASTVIVTNNITGYMNKICTGLMVSLIYVLFSEILMFCIIRFSSIDIENDLLFLPGRWIPDLSYIIRHIINPNAICWTSYIIFRIFYKKASFFWKKVSVCSIYMICATVYAFEHWGFIFLSVIYTIPVVLSCPLGKKTHIQVFIACVIMQIIYCIVQYYNKPSIYNILVALLCLAILVAVYFITLCVYNSLMTALSDVKNYEKLNTELKVRLYHDNLTGAYSKSALMNENESLSSYVSIGFIDLDNFKDINDTYGHDIGDEILKLLVSTLQGNGETVYRFGGDEFIILSHMDKTTFTSKLSSIKSEFISKCERNFHMTATFSAGVVQIKAGMNLAKLLKESDKLMYTAKNSGKNKVEVK